MNIRARRRFIGFKSSYVAKMIRISRSTLSRWENGNYDPKLSQMKRLSRILRVNIGELFFNGLQIQNNSNKFNPSILRLRRMSMRLKLDEFSNMIEISDSVLIRIEKGEYDIRLSLINKIHEILRIPIEELVRL